MRPWSAIRWSAAVAAALLAGCAASPPTLIAIPASSESARPSVGEPGASGGTIVVQRVVVPEYLATRRVRYWLDESSLREWPDTYWAERIEIGTTRAFVAALGRDLPGWTVCESSCGEPGGRFGVRLELQRLDYVRGERLLKVAAQISVTGNAKCIASTATNPRADTAVVASGPAGRPGYQELTLRVNADSAAAQAQAISDLLQVLAGSAAALVRQHAGPAMRQEGVADGCVDNRESRP